MPEPGHGSFADGEAAHEAVERTISTNVAEHEPQRWNQNDLENQARRA